MREEHFLAEFQTVLETAHGDPHQFRARDLKLTEFEHMSDEDSFTAEEREGDEAIKIESLPEGLELSAMNPVIETAAIDTSSLILGDTDQGSAVAIRGAIIVQRNDEYERYILGPYVAHVTPLTAPVIYSKLREALGITSGVSEPSLFT